MHNRPYRSALYIPGSKDRALDKARGLPVDVILFDLEDAVAPDAKVAARDTLYAALADGEYGQRLKVVRINGLDTHYMYRDVVDVVEQAGDKLDLIMIPKVGTASDVYALDMMVTQIETAKGYTKKIGFEHIIETALGMANVEAIAAAPGRLEAMHFGVADYAASTRARTVVIGGLNPDYPGDQWHFALSRMTVACRAYGRRAIDGPFGDFSDPDAYIASAKRAATLGIEGKWAIHPTQIELANSVFSPPEAEVDRARRIIEELRKAEAAGKGAAALDGKMIDAASERMANNVIVVADAIAAKG